MLQHDVSTIAETFVLFLAVVHATSDSDGSSSCLHAKLGFESSGFRVFDIPTNAVSGERLNVCSGMTTCCTSVMESYLINLTHWQFYDRVMSTVRKFQLVFANATSTFDDFFVELLDISLVEMHRMLIKKYGLLYEQNSQLFLDLFHDLQTYFKTGSVDLSDALDIFFETLFQRVFVLFNTQYVFDEAYEDCVAENTKIVAPFGDVPRQLAPQVKRSFIAARMFVRALAFGRDILVDMMRKLELLIPARCSRDLMRLYGCQYCQLSSSVLPCHSSCSVVVDQCFAGLAVFSQEWDVFIRELVLLAMRLEGPLNIERVVTPIYMKLSDAIVNFQENSVLISSKVFEICGQPSVGRRRKRHASAVGHSLQRTDSTRWPVVRGQNHNRDSSDTRRSAGVADVVQKIRIAVNATCGFWNRLSHDECFNFTLPSSSMNATCWNGTHLVHDSSAVNSSAHIADSASSVTHQQLFRLITINNKLRKSRLGHEDWNEGDGDNGSGDASGDDASGSGDDSKAVYVNDLWHFVPSTTYSLLGSTVANESSMLSSAHAFVVWLVVVCVIGMMSKPLAQ